MRSFGRSRSLTLRQLAVLIWLLAVAVLALGLLVVGLRGPQPHSAEQGRAGSATTAPLSGRRWFWERSQWQQPEAPVP